MARYEESMFAGQDDLVERAVAWLCQASEDAGESVGEWAETVGLVGDRLADLYNVAITEADGVAS